MTFFSACSFGVPERRTNNSTRSVHRTHTRSVHHEHYSLVTSTDHMCACGSKPARLKSHCIIFACLKESVIWPAMSSPCWSLPHLVSSSPPQYEAPTWTGQHDVLQDDTVLRAPLPEPIQPTEPLSHVNYESGGNPRNTSPTGYEPKELATISESSLEDREF